MNRTDPDYLLGEELLQKLVRGDVMVGMLADAPTLERDMLDALWRAAMRGSAAAYRALASIHYARLVPAGAYDGADPADHLARAWSPAATDILDDDFLPLQAALRCYFEAARLGDRVAASAFAQAARDSNRENQEIALRLLQRLDQATPDEQYRMGLVQHWLGNLEQSARLHLAAAERGCLDAQFELYIYYAQGIGVEPDAEQSQAWLKRAAEGEHPRALYNLGGAYASGADGDPDYDKAADYYSRAARRGNGRAAATLGYMILNEEIRGTRDQAIEWLDLADESGYPSWELLAGAGLDDPRTAGH